MLSLHLFTFAKEITYDHWKFLKFHSLSLNLYSHLVGFFTGREWFILILTADINCLRTNLSYECRYSYVLNPEKSSRVANSVNPSDAGSKIAPGFWYLHITSVNFRFISSHFRGLQINFAYKPPSQKPTVQCLQGVLHKQGEKHVN